MVTSVCETNAIWIPGMIRAPAEPAGRMAVLLRSGRARSASTWPDAATPKRGGPVKLSSKTPAVLTAAALSLVLASTALPGICPEADTPPEPGTAPATVHGLNPADMNTTVSACTDFNQYANGG